MTQKLNNLLNVLPIEKYNDVIDYIEFILSRAEPELLLEEADELRYTELLKISERSNSKDAERRLLSEDL